MAGHQYPGEAGGAHQLPAATAGPGSQGPRYVDRAAAQSWGRDRADGEEGVSQSPTAPGQPAWTRHMGTAPRKRSPHRSLARCHSRLCPICPHVVPTEGCFPRASPWGCSGGNIVKPTTTEFSVQTSSAVGATRRGWPAGVQPVGAPCQSSLGEGLGPATLATGVFPAHR